MQIRDATPADLPALLEIYNEAVANTTASWDYEPWSPVQHADWYADKIESGFPVLVAVEDDEVLGVASFGEFHHKVGYAHTREHKVYLRPSARGRGLARLLLEPLIERARQDGVHTLIALVSADNEASLRLHARLGFVEVGRLREVGWKFDRWLDLAYLQLML